MINLISYYIYHQPKLYNKFKSKLKRTILPSSSTNTINFTTRQINWLIIHQIYVSDLIITENVLGDTT